MSKNIDEITKENEKLKSEIQYLVNENLEGRRIIKELETELKEINKRTQCYRR
jgi:regulator of replication initiation timing